MEEGSGGLLRVKDGGGVRSWLRTAPVTSAIAVSPPPSTALQVAFTAAGLKALGVPDPVLAGFPSEFLAGTTQQSRSRRLGDGGSTAPSPGDWRNSANLAHIVRMFCAEHRR